MFNIKSILALIVKSYTTIEMTNFMKQFILICSQCSHNITIATIKIKVKWLLCERISSPNCYILFFYHIIAPLEIMTAIIGKWVRKCHTMFGGLGFVLVHKGISLSSLCLLYFQRCLYGRRYTFSRNKHTIYILNRGTSSRSSKSFTIK